MIETAHELARDVNLALSQVARAKQSLSVPVERPETGSARKRRHQKTIFTFYDLAFDALNAFHKLLPASEGVLDFIAETALRLKLHEPAHRFGSATSATGASLDAMHGFNKCVRVAPWLAYEITGSGMFDDDDIVMQRFRQLNDNADFVIPGDAAQRCLLELKERSGLWESNLPVSVPVLLAASKVEVLALSPSNNGSPNDFEIAVAEAETKLKGNLLAIFRVLLAKHRAIGIETLKAASDPQTGVPCFSDSSVHDSSVTRQIKRLRARLDDSPFSIGTDRSRVWIDCPLLSRTKTDRKRDTVVP